MNGLASLDSAWVSRASAKQRRGRAGRVQPGVAYHVYPKALHDTHFAEYKQPELLRAELEQVILLVGLAGTGNLLNSQVHEWLLVSRSRP